MQVIVRNVHYFQLQGVVTHVEIYFETPDKVFTWELTIGYS